MTPPCGVGVGIPGGPSYAVGMSCPGQDPTFLTLDALVLEGPQGAHCVEGKTEALRSARLAQSQCACLVGKLVSQTQRQCLAKPLLGVGRCKMPPPGA